MANANVKVTINSKYEAIIEALQGVDFAFEDGTTAIEFLKDRQEKAKKRSASNGKPTPKQVENEGIKETLLEVLAETPNGIRVGDLATKVGLSSSKVTALLTQLLNDGKVNRQVDKKISLYSLA